MKLLRNLIVVLAAALLASTAMAQGGGGQGRGQRGFGFPDPTGVSLLGRKDVQDDLKITDEQKTKLNDLRQKATEQMRANGPQPGGGGGGFDREAFMKAIKTMMESMKKDIEKILTKDQMTRLREINIQLAGNTAATWEDVQKEIPLTGDQIAKIKNLQTKQTEANAALRRKVDDQEMTFQELQEAMKKNNDTFGVELGKILTDAQKAKLKTMGGKEFKAENNGGGR